MSCLVNPYGWRLYYRQVWKTTFYVPKTSYLVLNHRSKIFYEMLNNLFTKFNLDIKTKNFLRLYNFRIFVFFNKVLILVKFRLNWSTFFKKLLIATNRSLHYTGKYYTSTEAVYPIRSEYLKWVTKKKLFLTHFGLNPQSYYLKTNYFKIIKQKRKYRLAKLIFIYFSILPLLLFLKSHINKLAGLVYQNPTACTTHFFNLSWGIFNPMSLLKFVAFLLSQKDYSPIKTLYTVIRILNKLKKRQDLRGYKFLLAGRFSRRDRATFLWKTFGSVNLSARLASIDFYSVPIQLQYSKCIAKLWLCRA